MGVDKSYGSGYKNTGKAKPLTVAQKRTAAVSSRRVTGSAGSPITRNMRMASDIRTGRANVAEPFGVDFGFALPVNKIIEAAKALRGAGKIEKAVALEARVGAKQAGRYFGGTGKKSQGLGLPMDRAIDVGGRARDLSENAFPKLPNMGNIPGAKRSFDIYADPLEEGAYRFSGGVKPGRSRSWNPTVNVSISEAVGSGFKKIGKARKSGPRAK